jgi:hypothetical protein
MLNFDNLIGKKIRHCFVPADKASITFVMEDGFRRSLGVGAGNAAYLSAEPEGAMEGLTLKSATLTMPSQPGGMSCIRFATDGSDVVFAWRGTYLVELPE